MSVDDARSGSEGGVSADTSAASAALSEIRSTLLILGTQGATAPHFMIANWGTQASFDPWRYVILLKKTSHALAYAQKTGAFTVNLVHPDQKALVMDLQRTKGEKHAGGKGPLAAPRLPEAFAGFDCRVIKVEDVGGDHMLVVADIVDGWKRGDGPAATVQDLKLSYAG